MADMKGGQAASETSPAAGAAQKGLFKPVSSQVSFPEMEEGILAFWKERDIFKRSVHQRAGGPRFTIFEGPPTANGSPGIHHVLSRVFKDIFPRYKTMKGFYSPRKGGWDTHGLPVELEVEKELKIQSKAQIEEYGVARFNELCRQSVFRYVKDWEVMTERVAFWADLENAYVTYKNDYIETGWWTVKTLWDKGLVYQGRRVTPHCPRCGTTLSSHEVALGYKEDTPDPSVYVKFEVDLESVPASLAEHFREKTYLLAWTTTPWTLPGNTGLSVSAKDEYALVRLNDSGELLVLARALLGKAATEGYTEIASFTGASLVGMRYVPLYDPFEYGVPVHRFAHVGSNVIEAVEERPARLTYPVIEASFVSMEDGTGIVHTAPPFGEDDYGAGSANVLYFVQPVNLSGVFDGTYKWAGKFVKNADPAIMEDLKARGLLYRRETIKHTYPFCWRCDSPLLYYAKSSWYLKTSALKERLLSANEEINWYPEHIKHGRFGEWLRGNVDWAISRERYWGTPWPVWECGGCRHQEAIGGREQLGAKPGVAGFTADLDLHRPYVDQVTYRCPKCGGAMRRVPEVMDCWFDSGAMPLAQWHYPFENRDLVESGAWYPADFICEAVDQTRGWFYSLHAIATLLEAATDGRVKAPSYRNVVCLGLILDAKGDKMSKSRGNVVRPQEVIDAHGADAVRWYLYSAAPAGNSRRFSADLVAEGVRKFLLTLWNTYSFFVTYANIDGYTPHPDLPPQGGKGLLGPSPLPAPTAPVAPPPLSWGVESRWRGQERGRGEVASLSSRAGEGRGEALSELDRWIVSRLNTLVAGVTESLDGYDATGASRKLQDFVEDLSNWYVRRSRRRFWKSENDADKAAAYATLYESLVTLAKLLAPFTPFVAEEMYQNLVRLADPTAPESVHLTDYPVADRQRIDAEVERATDLTVRAVSLGRAARSKSKIKVRQPLQKLVVAVSAAADRDALTRQAPHIREELNVKEVAFADDDTGLVDFQVKAKLNLLGPKYGKEMGKIVAAVNKADARAIAPRVRAGGSAQIGLYTLEPSELELVAQDKPGFATASEGGLTVAVTTQVTPELAREGLARELVHRIQNMRKSAGFDIADRIVVRYQGDEEASKVFTVHAAYIQQETLAERLVRGQAPAGAYAESQKVDGATVELAVEKAG